MRDITVLLHVDIDDISEGMILHLLHRRQRGKVDIHRLYYQRSIYHKITLEKLAYCRFMDVDI